MARIRTVKPNLFRHEGLYKAERRHRLPLRLAFIAMFTVADREGRFKWRPGEIKPDVFPHEPKLNFGKVLDALESEGFLQKYEVDGELYGVIPTFREHQVINARESASILPPPNDSAILATREREVQTMHVHAHGEGKGKGREKEREGKAIGALVEFDDLHTIFVERQVSHELQRAWIAAYPDVPWIKAQIRKAIAWEASQPRPKKQFGSFITNWLLRGWDDRPRVVPPPPKALDLSSYKKSPEELEREDYNRKLSEEFDRIASGGKP